MNENENKNNKQERPERWVVMLTLGENQLYIKEADILHSKVNGYETTDDLHEANAYRTDFEVNNCVQALRDMLPFMTITAEKVAVVISFVSEDESE